MTTDAAHSGSHKAEEILRRQILWLDSEILPDEDLGSFCYSSPAEVIEALARCLPGERIQGYAFGREWQFLATPAGRLVPGVQVMVDGPSETVDGLYRCEGSTILREAQARDLPLFTKEPSDSTDAPLVGLWFGESERYLVTANEVSISNHHLVATLPATRATLQRITRTSAPAIVAVAEIWPESGQWSESETEGVPSLEVARETVLMGPRWRDPEAVLTRRIEMAQVSAGDGRAVAEMGNGDILELGLVEHDTGWSAEVMTGTWVFRSLAMQQDGQRVVVRVEPALHLDLAVPSVRARMAFDLMAMLLEG